MILLREFTLLWSGLFLLVIAGCQTVPKPEEFFQPVSLEERYLHTRIYPTDDEVNILNVCADLLLDNGFQIKEVTAQVILAILVALSGNAPDPKWDENQIMRISLVVTPIIAEQKKNGSAYKFSKDRLYKQRLHIEK